jgi:hypothetical protein
LLIVLEVGKFKMKPARHSMTGEGWLFFKMATSCSSSLDRRVREVIEPLIRALILFLSGGGTLLAYFPKVLSCYSITLGILASNI